MGEMHSALYTVVIHRGVLQSYSIDRNSSLIEPLKSRWLVLHHCQGRGGRQVKDTGMELAMCFVTAVEFSYEQQHKAILRHSEGTSYQM